MLLTWIWPFTFTSVYYIFECSCVMILPWRARFSISYKVAIVVMNSHSFCLSGKILSWICFWKSDLPDKICLVGNFFFQFFKSVSPLSPCLQGSWREVSYLCSSAGNMFFPSGIFQDFFFSLIYCNLKMIWQGVVFLACVLLDIRWAS